MYYKPENKPRKLPVVISLEEFNQLLKVTKHKHHRLAFKLGFLCGLRVSEVVKLQPEDVDYGRRLLFIRQAKGSKDRYVPFPEQFSRDLKNLPVNVCIRALQKAITNLSIKAGITKHVHFHTLRHSCATYYISKGMGLPMVQQLLGHARIEMTMIYTHVTPDNVRKEMDEIWK